MIYFIRHGQTETNKAHRLQGHSDIPLNDVGREQAGIAAAWFRTQGITFDLIYSSPLVRAVETARILEPDVPIITDERIIEIDYGIYEGMDLKDPAPEIVTFFSDFVHNPAPAGMEALPHIIERFGAFLEDIRPEAEGKNILISTHAIAMKGGLEYLTPSSGGSYWATHIANCDVYAASFKDGEYGIPCKVWEL